MSLPRQVCELAAADPALLAPLRDLRQRGPGSAVVVEGVEAVRWLLASRLATATVLCKPGLVDHLAPDLAACRVAPTVVTAEPAALSELLGFDFTRGVIAWAPRPPALAPADCLDRAAGLLVLDGIHDPVNVGTLLRSARCLGLGGALLGPGCADPFYRRSVRASVGHSLHLPWAECGDLVDQLQALRAGGWWLAAGHRGPLAAELHRLSAVPRPWALVLGNEDRGPSPAVLSACHQHLAIAMADGVDSLNVAAAGAVLMHALRTVPAATP